MAEFTFRHGDVSVPSLDEAIEWYGNALGFIVEKRFYIEAAKLRGQSDRICRGA